MEDIFTILIIGIAVSYGWGMRGSLMGGERGAALPGALLGMFLALLSGSSVISEHFYIFAAAGASAMAFGGTEPYGETLGFVLHRGKEDYNPQKGYAGVFLKGALWQGITGAVIGMTFSAVCGKLYSGYDIIITFALIPVTEALGCLIFNKPYDVKNGKLPKIYFSIDSREEWGGNVLTLIMMLVLILIRKDYYAFFFSLTGIIGGGAGFTIGLALYSFLDKPDKNGVKPFGKFSRYLGGWKAMELTFGFIAGVSFAVYFVLTKGTMLQERTGGLGGTLPDGILTPYSSLLSYISLALIPIAKIFSAFEDKLGSHTIDLIDRPVLFVIPTILALTGCGLGAKFASFAFIVYYAGEKVVFSRSEKCSNAFRISLAVIFGIITAASVLLCIFTDLTPAVYIITYTLFYIAADNIPFKKPEGSRITVMTCFVIQSVFLIAVTALIK